MILRVSIPVLIPSRSVTAANASTGVLPAPAPNRGGQPGIRDAEAEILVTVNPYLRVVAELGDERGDPVAHPVHDQRAGRVHHVDALGPGIGHDPRLLREDLRRLADHGRGERPDR